jgi:hypothetical protein
MSRVSNHETIYSAQIKKTCDIETFAAGTGALATHAWALLAMQGQARASIVLMTATRTINPYFIHHHVD